MSQSPEFEQQQHQQQQFQQLPDDSQSPYHQLQRAHEYEPEQQHSGKRNYRKRKNSKNHTKAHKQIIENQNYAYRADSAPNAVSPDMRKRQIWIDSIQQRPDVMQINTSNKKPNGKIGKKGRKASPDALELSAMNRERAGLVPLVPNNLQNQYDLGGVSSTRRRGSNSVSGIIPQNLVYRGKCVPNYMNFAGPGEYDTPMQVNVNRSVDSQKRQMPTFSMGSKTKMPYFPKLDLDLTGKDAPSMTKYTPNLNLVKESHTVNKFPQKPRFSHAEHKKGSTPAEVPIQYQSHATGFLNHSLSRLDSSQHSISISKMGGSQMIHTAEKGFYTGKRWTLHHAKEYETTPGPVYNPKVNDSKLHFKNKFGAGRAEAHAPRPKKDPAAYGRESPGHIYSIPDVWARGNIQNGVNVTNQSISQDSIHSIGQRSQSQLVKGFAVPKQKRGSTDVENGMSKGDIRPSATAYENTNEIMRKHVMRFPGQTAIGNGARKIDFAKYSSVHSELVEKGLL